MKPFNLRLLIRLGTYNRQGQWTPGDSGQMDARPPKRGLQARAPATGSVIFQAVPLKLRFMGAPATNLNHGPGCYST